MSLSADQKIEVEKIFQFLDKDVDDKLTSREVVIGLGMLGRNCTINEQNKIKKDYPYCDLDTFKDICAEKVKFNEVEASFVRAFNILESKEKPGYISQKEFIHILKQFNEKITQKDINDIIKEVGSGPDGYINLENLAKEMLVK